jgi:hypothetical protein
MIKAMVRQGDANSLIHPDEVRVELAREDFVPLDFGAPPMTFHTGLVWLADRSLSPEGIAFAREMFAEVGGLTTAATPAEREFRTTIRLDRNRSGRRFALDSGRSASEPESFCAGVQCDIRPTGLNALSLPLVTGPATRARRGLDAIGRVVAGDARPACRRGTGGRPSESVGFRGLFFPCVSLSVSRPIRK